LLTHPIVFALFLALDKAGSNIAAKIAMMAITTNNSISVKPEWRGGTCFNRDVFKRF